MPCPSIGRARGRLLLLHERLEIRHRLFHRPGRFDHLGQEHLARPEQVADDLHAVHERAFDDQQRTPQLLARLFGVFLDEVDDPVHKGVLQTFPDRRLTPRQVLRLLLALPA